MSQDSHSHNQLETYDCGSLYLEDTNGLQLHMHCIENYMQNDRCIISGIARVLAYISCIRILISRKNIAVAELSDNVHILLIKRERK